MHCSSHAANYLGSLHASGPPAGTPPGEHLRGEPAGGDGTSPDHDGCNDAVAHSPVTLNAVRDPGGPQGRPDHLWQEERQAHVEQLGHGLPRSRITDGPCNRAGPWWTLASARMRRLLSAETRRPQHRSELAAPPPVAFLPVPGNHRPSLRARSKARDGRRCDKSLRIISYAHRGLKTLLGGLPWCPVVKNPPSNTGDTGSIPGQGTKIPHAQEQVSPHTARKEPAFSNQDPTQPKINIKKKSHFWVF